MNFKITNPYEMITQYTRSLKSETKLFGGTFNCELSDSKGSLDSHIKITLGGINNNKLSDHISYEVWIELLTFFKTKLPFKKSLSKLNFKNVIVSSIRKYIKILSEEGDVCVMQVMEVDTDSNFKKLFTETISREKKIFSNSSSEYVLQLNTKFIKDEINISNLKSHMKYDSVLDCLEYTFNFDKYKCVFSEIVPQEENCVSHKYYTITIFDYASNLCIENILDILLFNSSSDNNYWKLLPATC